MRVVPNMSRYVISDLHIGHNNISKFRNTGSSSEEQWELAFEGIEKIPKKACVSTDTEVLTAEGWKLSQHITESDLIASKNLNTGFIDYQKPSRIDIFKDRQLYSVKSRYQDELVSDGHKCVYKGQGVSIETLFQESEVRTTDFDYAGEYLVNSSNFTSMWVKWITWVVTDGCMVQGETKNKKRIQFKLSKQQKIDNLENLLKSIGIKYTKRVCKKTGVNKLQPYYIRVYGDAAREVFKFLGGVKAFPESFKYLTGEHWQAFYDTLSITDGRKNYNVLDIVTISEKDADVIQSTACINNYACRVEKSPYYKSGFVGGKEQYHITISPNKNLKKGYTKIQKEGLGDVVAISVPNKTLITRRGGKVVVTGNCI